MKPTNAAKTPYHGRLGRTTLTSVMVRTTTGASFPASVPMVLNVKENPELKEALVKGTLYEVTCPLTGKQHWLAFPVWVHDEALGLYALVLPEGLRHEELRHRIAFLEELSQEREVVPAYVRECETVFGGERLGALERRLSAPAAAAPAPVIAAPVAEVGPAARRSLLSSCTPNSANKLFILLMIS